MKSYTYVYPVKNMEHGPSGREKAQYAFMRFADVCDAYHILKNDKDYVPYRLDGNDMEGYWTVLHGKAGAALRELPQFVRTAQKSPYVGNIKF